MAKGAFTAPEPAPRRRIEDARPAKPAPSPSAPSKVETAAPLSVYAPRETSPDNHGTVPVSRDDAPAAQQTAATRQVAVGATPDRAVANNRRPSVVEDGPLQGFSVDEYVAGVVNGIHDAMGEADLLTAGCALDQALGEFLAIAQDSEGNRTAQEFGVRFCQTALPFAQLQLEPPRYGDVRRLKKG